MKKNSPLSDEALNQLFREARTPNTFTDDPVSDQTVRDLYDLVKQGPSAYNSQPLRLVFLRPGAPRERLLPFMAPGNVSKVRSAPMTAIAAVDADFHENIPQVFPHAPELKDSFGDVDARREMGTLNAALQLGLLVAGVRALGLAAGPITGFDRDSVSSEFFPEQNRFALALVNIGYPGPDAWERKLPRLRFDQAATIL